MSCAALYEPAPDSTPERPRVKTSERVERVVRETGGNFGPYGETAAGIVLAALSAGAWWHNRRALKKHIDTPPAK